MTDVWSRMTIAADAAGKNCIIGVRPGAKGWFANCDGVEFDGSSPAQAVQAVIDELQQSWECTRAAHENSAGILADRLAKLTDL